MKLIIPIITALLPAALLAGINAEDAGHPNRERPASVVGVVFSSARTNYPVGSSIPISVTITNRSSHSITIPNGSPWIEGQFRFGVEVSVSNADKVVFGPVPIPGPCVLPGEKDFVRLAGGSTLVTGFDISEFVPYSAGERDRRPIGKRHGAYTVRVRLVNRRAGWGIPSDRGPVLKKIDDMWSGESDWVALVIGVQETQAHLHNQPPEGTR